MFRILFTLDYEIHGNGEGDPQTLLVDRTNRLMNLFDKYGAILTIMADVAEILKFKEYFEKFGKDDYSYVKIVKQLKNAVARGHDVQLHIHPSYFNAKYRNNKWYQDYSEYNLAELEKNRISEIIKLSKNYLENILREEHPQYNCIAFRSANWAINPPKNIVQALIKNKIQIDTSVFKYGKSNGIVNFDYSNAYSALRPWPIDENNVCKYDKNGKLFEFPIYCEKRSVLAFFSLTRLFNLLQTNIHSVRKETQPLVDQYKTQTKQFKLIKLTKYLNKFPWKADFNQCTGNQLISCLQRIKNKYNSDSKEYPFVLIGHSKLFTKINECSLKSFLEYVDKNSDTFSFGKFSDFDLKKFT